MDMTVIDTVSADSLEVGDTIRFYDEEGNDLGLMEIKRIEDDWDYFNVTSEDGETMRFIFHKIVEIYGYEDSED